MAKKRSSSIKLARGKKLEATNIRNESEDVLLEPEDVRRWQIAEVFTDRTSGGTYVATTTPGRSQSQIEAEIWPSIDLDPKNIDWRLLLALNASGILYGGLHLLAWNAQFSTGRQKGLWRLASFAHYDLCPCIECGIVDRESHVFLGINAKIVGHMMMVGFYKSFYRLKIAAQICFLPSRTIYVSLRSRIYLVVECFISLSL